MRYFFVLGMPKSGTTWVQRTLDAHPHVSCRGEGKFHRFREDLEQIFRQYDRVQRQEDALVFGEVGYPPVDGDEFFGLFRRFVEQRLTTRLAKPDVRFAGDKNPHHGFHLKTLARTMPDALYLNVIRDGRDTLVSFWHHHMRLIPERWSRQHPDFAVYALRYAQEWSAYYRAVRAQVAELNLRYFEFRYEDMKLRPAEVATGMFDFLGADTAPETVARCLGESSFETMSGGRSAGQEDKGSFFRKGVVGDWRNHMGEDLCRRFLDATDGFAAENGYT